MWVVDEPKKLKKFVDALASITLEAKFFFDKEKLRVESLATSTFVAYWFDYALKGQTEQVLALNTEMLSKALGKHNADKVTLSIDDNKLCLESEHKGRTTKQEIPVLDDEYIKTPPREVLPGPARLSFDTKEFFADLDDTTAFSEVVRMSLENDSFELESYDDTQASKTRIKRTVEQKGDAKGSYDFSLFKEFQKLGKEYEQTSVAFGKDYPLKLVWEDDNTRACVVIAPRIDV
jgi:hypothetical protein